MANKLWYEKIEVDGIWYPQDKSKERQFIQRLIDLYCSELFQVPEDINPDNFQYFLKAVLTQYQNYNIDIGHLLDLGDIMSDYFDDCFGELPTYAKDDRRELVLTIFENCLECVGQCLMMPEDVPFIIEFLNVPEDQVVYMYDRLKQYFDQFDVMKRSNEETPRRLSAIKKQRQDALEKGDPLPIRPMGIKLDMCYKNPKQQLEE